MIITEGVLNFDFQTDDGSLLGKYDEWCFYRHHFCKIAEGIQSG